LWPLHLVDIARDQKGAGNQEGWLWPLTGPFCGGLKILPCPLIGNTTEGDGEGFTP